MASLEELRTERLKKLELLRAKGINPYPVAVKRDYELAEVVKNFTKLSTRKKPINLVGRVRALRGQGGILFFDFNDGTANFQGVIKKDEITEADFALFRDTVDIGDFIGVAGSLFVTKREEKTLAVKSWQMLAKSLRPLPDKWHGLADVEERFRRRYLDSLMSPEVRERYIFRSNLITAIRNFLNQAGFLEVETPILQPLAGGATAKPFKTHHDALDIEMFLRVSEELYLKRLLVGGFPRVYSLSRNFRNEGIDATHNPEFTMLEFYEAYSSAETQRTLVEKLMLTLVKELTGGTTISFDNQLIDFASKFKVVTYFDLLKRYALIPDPENIKREDLFLRASQLGIKAEKSEAREKLMDAIYKKVCRPKLIQPTFIIDYPKNYLPLAKQLENNLDLVDAFQLVAGGMEVAKAFSELNDPLEQTARFAEQDKQKAAGDAEAQATDQDFIEALEYGMPPAGGVGIGIDRLMMLLTNTQNIREVIFFPTLKPKQS
jgi:lysyl-tRNA synthetase class 2